eukprot:scaffold22264_cov62-Phaeocystis_antarctica.AAC.5
MWPALSSARTGSGAFSCDVSDAPCSMSSPTQLLSASGLRESEQSGEPPMMSPFLSDGAAPCLRRHSTLARMLLASPVRHTRCSAVARMN